MFRPIFFTILTLAIFFTPALYADTPGARHPIPGIDPIDRAVESDPSRRPQENQPQPENKEQPNKEQQPVNQQQPENKEQPQEQKPDQTLPFLRGIKIEPYGNITRSIRITWQVQPNSDTPIWVGRYIRPVVSKNLVFEAYNLTSPPLGPKETEFIDRNLPDGTFYYVIVTSRELSRDGTLQLLPDVNYTTQPYIVYSPRPQEEDKKPEEQKPVEQKPNEEDYHIFGLLAVNGENDVKLNWTPARAHDIVYNVYRIEQPLDTPESLSRAVRLGTLAEDVLRIEDPSPLNDKTVHYAVTVTDRKTGTEFKGTRTGVNWISFRFHKQEIRKEEIVPDALTAYQDSRNSTKLLWVDPDGDFQDFSVYRYQIPIMTDAVLNRATLLGRANKGAMIFEDRNLNPGQYYYAIIPRDRQGRELRAFYEGRTFTGFAVTINQPREERKPEEDKKPQEEKKPEEDKKPEPAAEPIMLYFTARSDTNTSVRLEWGTDPKGNTAFKYRLYRSENPMRNPNEVRNNGALMNVVGRDVTQYLDSDLAKGRYYYAIVVELAETRVQESMIEGKNFLHRPVEVQGEPVIVQPEQKPVEQKPVEQKPVEQKPTEQRPEQHPEEHPDQRPAQEEKKPEEVSTDSLEDVNRVLARTYERRLYGEAVRQLAPMAGNPRGNPDARARALFFTGLSYFQTGQYRSAMEIFLNELVQSKYPERSRFWYRRCVERVR